jgi:hypothetical protein
MQIGEICGFEHAIYFHSHAMESTAGIKVPLKYKTATIEWLFNQQAMAAAVSRFHTTHKQLA